MADEALFRATGRRKNSSAQVILNTQGKGAMTVNGRAVNDYFFTIEQRTILTKALAAVQMGDKVNVVAKVNGGGLTGQAGAISLGISRALLKFNAELRPTLRKQGYLTRDPRAKERKKYGRKGARRRFQWTKH